LSYLEEHILGARRTQEDVPGWMIPGLYFDYLDTGDARPLRSIFYHNAMDILTMAALLNHVTNMLEDPLNGSVVHGVDLVAIAKLLEDLGQPEAAARCYAGGLACDLPNAARREAEQRWSMMEKRRENLSAAIAIWRQAAERKEVFAFVELAKHYEHRARDYELARHWTQAALEVVKASGFPRLERRSWQPELEHRLERIQKKLKIGA
jgi:tetratricopeptide (TPR) repeat protein